MNPLIEPSPSTERTIRGYAVHIVLGPMLLLALLLFLPAGDLGWIRGWTFFVVFVAAWTVSGFYLWRVNPEFFVAQSRFRKGSKRWDVILLCFWFPAIFAIFAIAALDAGRFHWFLLPWWVSIPGYGLVLAAMGIVTWAAAVNKFFEPTVRIQQDRGHEVIDIGPYAIVRHPVYVGWFVMWAGSALSLGSLWALIPVGLWAVMMILRTYWEDETLQAELPGYKEYAARVRYKLIPGVW